MFKYIYELIQMHRELHGAMRVMRSKRKERCRNSWLPPDETHLLGLKKGSYIWMLLAEYKIYAEENRKVNVNVNIRGIVKEQHKQRLKDAEL